MMAAPEMAAPVLPIRATPYRHQIEAYQYTCGLFGLPNGPMKSGGCALLMEMGTGKTITSIAITGALLQAGKIDRVLIVAPLSILGVWEEEFQKFAAFPYALAVLTGPGSRKLDTLRHMTGAALQVVVVNYESAWRMEKDLLAWRPDLIIADEGHKIKTHNIQSYRCTMSYGGKSYVDVITVEDKSDPYVSEMLSIGGFTVKNNLGGLVPYVIVRTNQKEVDPLMGAISETAPANPASGTFWYKVDHTAKAVTLMKYNGSAWAAATEKQSLTYTWYKQDKDGKAVVFGKTGKVIYLSAEDIDSIATLQCDVSNS